MSAYRHFASKDDLVAAALERYNPRHVRWLVGAGSAGAGPGLPGAGRADPAGRILSAFDRLESAAGAEGFRGCPFVDAALGAPEVGAAVALVIDGAAVQAALAPDQAARQRVVRRGRRVAEMLLTQGIQS